MTTEAQRIAIAEACGWRDCYMNQNAEPWGLAPSSDCFLRLPDYPNNLNAMHEAESHLGCAIDTDGTLEFAYELQLIQVIKPSGWRIYYATAAQRAEAFLKTIDKWTTEQ